MVMTPEERRLKRNTKSYAYKKKRYTNGYIFTQDQF